MFGLSQKDKNRNVHRAIRDNNIEWLKKAIAKGGSATVPYYPDYGPPLFLLMQSYGAKFVTAAIEVLVKAGADINQKDDERTSPLHYLIIHNRSHTDAIAKMIELKADVNAVDKRGWTPLFYALNGQAWDAAGMIIGAGGAQRTQDTTGKTHLLLAIEKDAPVEILKGILKSEVDINATTKELGNALGVAVGKRNFEYVETLLSRKDIAVDARKQGDKAPLVQAVYNGEKEIASLLLDAGASVDLASGHHNRTALTEAAHSGNQEIFEMLLKAKASLDLADGNGMTPLAHAALNGNIRMVMTLMAAAEEQKIKLELQGPLMAAAERGHGRILELLIAAGADVNLADKDSRTPLMRAVHSDQIEALGILIKAGAQPGATDDHGLTAYDLSVSSNKNNSKTFLARYRNETVKAATVAAGNAVTAVMQGNGFLRLNDHSLEVREGDSLTMTFNFWTQQVIFRDVERSAPVTVINFSEMQRQDAIKEAFEKLKELGGNPPDPSMGSVHKKQMPGLAKP